MERQVFNGMERLVHMIAELRSPQSGWPSELPQTPEHLAPYVLEEVNDVLDAIAQSLDSPNKTVIPAVSALTSCPFPFITIEELMSRLLWDFVKSSYSILRGIGGIKAGVQKADGNWEIALLRIMPGLQIQAPQSHWVIDVATSQVFHESDWRDRCCPLETVVEIREGNFSAQPMSLEDFASDLEQKILLTAPVLAQWLEEISVEFLEPDKDWQSGKIHLKIDFELSRIPGGEEGNESRETLTPAMIRLCEPHLETLYQQNAIISAFVDFWTQLNQDSLTRDRTDLTQTFMLSEETPETAEIVTKIIATATAALDSIATQAEEIRDSVRSHPTPIDDWIHRLLWHLIGTSYAVMQFVGGVAAQVLQPNQEWQPGTLRLRAIAHAATPTRCWAMDLATGESLHFNDQTLDPEGIIQLTPTDDRPELNAIAVFSTQLLADIRRHSPILISLMDGIAVELQDSEQNWEPGTLQLTIDLAFLPKTRPSFSSPEFAEISVFNA